MNESAFFDAIRATLFGGKLSQPQIDGINGVIEAMAEVGDGDQDTLAYALATAYHETGRRMVPVREGFAKSDSGARQAVANLARKRGPASAVARYAKPAGPHGHVYYGRGHAQLTWLENYQRSSADAGVDLVVNPDAMLDPRISARVLIRGIMDGRWNGQGRGLDHYEGGDDFLSDAEAAEARRTVNGKDKAALIAGYHRKFYDALDVAGWSAAVRPVALPPISGVKPAPRPAADPQVPTSLQKAQRSDPPAPATPAVPATPAAPTPTKPLLGAALIAAGAALWAKWGEFTEWLSTWF